MDDLARRIALDVQRDPTDFNAREELWMEREELRLQYRAGWKHDAA